MKKLLIISLLLVSTSYVAADKVYVVQTLSDCLHFIASGPNGLYVLEWFGGQFPLEGFTIEGDINSFGFKDVTYNGSRSGRVWVEDYRASSSAAWDVINEHCD